MEINTDLTQNILAILPEILLVLLGVVVLFIDLSAPESRRRQTGYWTGIGMFLIAAFNIAIARPPENVADQLVLGGMLRHDDFTQIFRTMVYISGGFTHLISLGS